MAKMTRLALHREVQETSSRACVHMRHTYDVYMYDVYMYEWWRLSAGGS